MVADFLEHLWLLERSRTTGPLLRARYLEIAMSKNRDKNRARKDQRSLRIAQPQLARAGSGRFGQPVKPGSRAWVDPSSEPDQPQAA